MDAFKLLNPLRILAIIGDCLFILWVLFNAMDSGWHGTVPEILSAITLSILLLVNIYLLHMQPRRK